MKWSVVTPDHRAVKQTEASVVPERVHEPSFNGRSYFGPTWTERAVLAPDERDCELVYSGVCERPAFPLDLHSIRCQISNPQLKTHRNPALICSGKKNTQSSDSSQQRGATECIIKTESSLEEGTAGTWSSKSRPNKAAQTRGVII